MNNQFLESQKKIFSQWQDYLKTNNMNFDISNWSNLFINPLSNFDSSDILNEFNKFYKDFQKSFTGDAYGKNDYEKIFKEFSENYNKIIFKTLGIPDYSPTNFLDSFKNFWNNFNFSETAKNPADFFNIFNSMQPPSMGIFDKLFNIPAFGLNREYITLTQNLLKDYKEYAVQVEKFKNMIAEQTQHGFNLFWEEIKNQPQLDDFDMFFNKWVEKNEEIFQNFFKSKEYGELLKELISAGSKLKKSIDEYYEILLKGTNIATKYEIDRANKEIYKLKKEVKQLKKIIEDLSDKVNVPKTGKKGGK